MSFFLFVDESGIDRRDSPYEVLAGISVHESRLWSLITAIQRAEVRLFGTRTTSGSLELKAKKLLKKKTFKLARRLPAIPEDERAALVRELFDINTQQNDGHGSARITARHLAALGQAKIAFCQELFEIAGHHQVKTFASIVPREAPRPAGSFLRKDYSYLFERFYHFLESASLDDQGVVVFDELERSRCTILIEQMSRYFRETMTGRHRASRVIPEPFFVHSELTTLVQVADLLAYIINWGVRVGGMTHPARDELCDLAEAVKQLRFFSKVQDEQDGSEHTLWSFAIINDLRPRDEKACSAEQ